MNDLASLIHLDQVSKVFYTDEVETHALDTVTLDIFNGEYIAVEGPSGCGKSTLLSILGLLDTPTDGSYTLHDRAGGPRTACADSGSRAAGAGALDSGSQPAGDRGGGGPDPGRRLEDHESARTPTHRPRASRTSALLMRSKGIPEVNDEEQADTTRRFATRAAVDAFLATHYRRFGGQAAGPAPLPEVPEDYDERLRALRRRLGLTQGALAERIAAAGKAVVYQWEARKRRALARVLDED